MSSEEFPETVRDDDPAFDTSRAHHARFYNYLLGGKDHFAADREYADAVTAIYPGTAAAARANRDFLGRAVRFLASEAGLSQFLDIGTGIPAPGSTHEVAQQARPDSRVVYVDNDPVVLAHARALLVAREPGLTEYLDADLRDPGYIIEEVAKVLDLSRPVGLLLFSVLHAIGDDDDPYAIVAALVDALPGGSYLALSHSASDLLSPEENAKFEDLTRQASHQQYTLRSQSEVARFFDRLDLVSPGVVQVKDWRPGEGDRPVDVATMWCGVALKR